MCTAFIVHKPMNAITLISAIAKQNPDFREGRPKKFTKS